MQNINNYILSKESGNEIKTYGNRYNSNSIKTTKYTIYNILPLSIYYQFHKVSNIYFLILIIVNAIPGVTSITNLNNIIPLCVVLIISLSKDYYEDYKRLKSNLQTNNEKSNIYKNNKLSNLKYKDVKIGDIIYLKENEIVPADVIIISNEIKSNITYIETSNLDGEKCAKPKYFIEHLTTLIDKKKQKIFDIDFKLTMVKPNPDLNNINGILEIKDKKYTITNKQFIPRGSKVKDINNLFALVILVGHDTKIMLNTIKKNNKFGNIEKRTNNLIIIILIFQVVLMTLSIILNYIYNRYLYGLLHSDIESVNLTMLAFRNFLTYWILLNTLIPISLIVTVETIKFIQGIFISLDKDLSDHNRNINHQIYNTNINEELGQISHILSDKTGTLTMNQMLFRYLNVGSIIYDFSHSEELKVKKIEDLKQFRLYNNVNLNQSHFSVQSKIEKKLTNKIKEIFLLEKFMNLDFYSNDNTNHLSIKNEDELVKFAIILLISCHDCFIKKTDNDVFYNGESPDEISFLEKLKELNVKIVEITEKYIEIDLLGEKLIINKWGIIEFDNIRKCMSVIVNFIFNDKEYNIVFTKGADSSIIERRNKINDDSILEKIKRNIQIFSNKGLRTLILGIKILSKSELDDFWIDYNKYNLSNKIEDISKWEYDLDLLGSTAVEDKWVPDIEYTIKNISNAGIKLWVLTGDKWETAKQIGFSSNIIEDNEYWIEIKNISQLLEFINKSFKKYNKFKNSLIIEGFLLNEILGSLEYKIKFYKIVKDFKACIFCRVTPIQKSLIVELLKLNNHITLAIGDGSNDISMIQKANYGIGILGNEGNNAASNSDFAIPNFNMLNKLLFYHGRLSYLRITKVILYFIYKNTIFTLPIFYFAFYSGFSGIHFFDEFFLVFYNTLMTALPLIPRSILDQNLWNYAIKYKNNYYFGEKKIIVNNKINNLFPFLYNIGKNNKIFKNKAFFVILLSSTLESMLLYFININIFMNYQYDQIITSMTLYTSILISVIIKLFFNTSFITFFHFFCSIVGSLLLFFIIALIYNDKNSYLYKSNWFYLKNTTYYLTVLLFALISIVLNLTIKLYKKSLFSEVEVIYYYLKNKIKGKYKIKNIIEKYEKLRTNDFLTNY